MEETLISCSQHSILQSDDSQSVSGSQGDQEGSYKPPSHDNRPLSHNKKPLNQDMTQKTRRRRVAEYRKQVEDWALVEGVSAGELLGYLLYLESYSANRALSSFAWNIFTGQFQSDKPEVSLEEAIWMIEKGSIS